ncbi:MAG: glycosyltransferase family 39 protein, partial [Thermomicrobiales bacterium]|nr:glycosyltransferase family 39 protein [Thermomicrobiales bacterium]
MVATAPTTTMIAPEERASLLVRARAFAVPAALLGIMVLAALLRFTGQNWDNGQYLHPDERFITTIATAIQQPSSIGQFFDSATNPANPYLYNGTYIYGTFPLYLERIYGELTGHTVYGDFHLAGRTMSAVFDLVTVFFLFLIGRRLFNEKVGLLASLLYALSVLPIQLSHFSMFDLIASTLCVLAFYFALRANDNGRWWEFVLAGIMVGLAVASKLSALPIAAVLALPLIEQLRVNGPDAFWNRKGRTGLPVLLGCLLAGLMAFWALRITQPFMFDGPGLLGLSINPQWSADVSYWRHVQSGEFDGNPSTQWANRTPIVFILKNFVLWGVGPVLGVVSLLALGLAVVRVLTARRWPPTWQLFIIAWPAFHLFYYGIGFIKAMRYTVAAYPFMALLAAGLLYEVWGYVGKRWPRYSWAGLIPIVLVIVPTALWAFAFTSIYTNTQTRIAASEWIYANIPEGTPTLHEHWDDPIPLNLPNMPGSGAYPGSEIAMYDDDNPEKLARLMELLETHDWIFVTSNRLYDSITRIPERWPMANEYYRMLFDGELGFDLVHTSTNYPTIFGIEINDDNAEEAFTVYDHPKVLIFQKNDSFDAERVQSQLAAALSGDFVRVKSADAGKNMLLMSDAERLIQQAGGTWSKLFDRGSIMNQHPVITWYLALQLMALAAIPLCWRALNRLPDRGYAVAKTVGLSTATIFAWLLASLHVMDWGRPAVLVGIIIVAMLSVLASAGRWRQIQIDLRASWRWIVAAELIFLAAFLIFVYFRSLNPDLWHPARGGEKPMEFAYFNAIIKSTHFPAYDPWFAGGYINYYYFGWVFFAALAHLTGVIPAVSFNLAVATVFALAILNSWSFASSALTFLSRYLRFRSVWYPIGLGLVGALFVGIIGNLDMARLIGTGQMGFDPVEDTGMLGLGSFGDIVRGVWRSVADWRMPPLDAFWTPTRIIDGTVNEFPYFSFLFADLHPHMMAIPFSLLAVVLALGIVASHMWPEESRSPVETGYPVFGIAGGLRHWIENIHWRRVLDRFWLLLLTGIITGMLFPLNTWDYPTYLVITTGSFLLLDTLGSVVAANRGRDLDWNLTFSTLRRTVVSAAVIVLIGRVLFLPYYNNYLSQIAGFDPWTEKSTTSEYLIIHGFFLFVIVSYLVIDLLQTTRPFNLGWLETAELPGMGYLRGAGAGDAGIVATSSGTGTASGTATVNPAWIVAGASGLFLILSIMTEKIMLLFPALLVLILAAAYQRQRDPLRLFLLGMVTVAVALSAAVENYTLRGDIGRMNTVFKFYLQIWVLYALVAAIALVLIVAAFRRWVPAYLQIPWAIVFVVLLAAT